MDNNKSHATNDDQPVYFAGLDVAPSSERRLVSAAINMLDLHNFELHTSSLQIPLLYLLLFRIFSKTLQLKKKAGQLPSNLDSQILTLFFFGHRIQSKQSLTMIRKLAIDYVNFIKECWVHASVSYRV